MTARPVREVTHFELEWAHSLPESQGCIGDDDSQQEREQKVSENQLAREKYKSTSVESVVYGNSAGPESRSDGNPESAFGFLLFIWRRKWVVVLALIISSGLGYLYYSNQTPVYRSRLQATIIRPPSPLGTPVGIDQSTKQQTTIVKSRRIVNAAINEHQLQNLPGIAGVADPAAKIIAGLSVNQEDGGAGSILTVTYTSEHREECPKVLMAVMEQFQVFLGDTYQLVSQEVVDLIEQARAQLDTEIGEARQQYLDFRYTAPPEIVFNGDAASSVHEPRLTQIQEEISTTVMSNNQLQSQLDHISEALAQGGDKAALRVALGGVWDTGGGLPLQTQLSPENVEILNLEMEEKLLLDDYGPDHPKIVNLRRKKTLLLERMSVRTGVVNVPQKPVKKQDFFETFLRTKREELRLNEQRIAALKDLFLRERELSRSLSNFQVQNTQLTSQLANKQALFEEVIGKMDQIDLVRGTGMTRAEIINEPSNGVKIAPSLRETMMSATLLGLLAGISLAFVIDSTDRSFRTPDEIREILGAAVVGHIPMIPIEEVDLASEDETEPWAGLDPVLRTVHQPRGRVAEAYRGVRTALNFRVRESGHKIIQVTSPSPGDGKTTLAGNLAVSIADSGKKTILLEGDFRRPRLHHLFNLENELGVTDVLCGTAELVDAAKPSPIDNLTVLPCGMRPHNPSELLMSRTFADLLHMLRDRYDMVVIDTPPVLAVTDPLNVAPLADGIFLVLRLSKNSRKIARRAIESLTSIDANLLGLIVNGVGSTPGYGYGYGYGYGSRGYKYGYGKYGYGGKYGSSYYGTGYEYAYGYGDGEYEYYADDSNPYLDESPRDQS